MQISAVVRVLTKCQTIAANHLIISLKQTLIMETFNETKTQEVIAHHLSAFNDADVDEILKDFTEDSEIFTPEGVLKGLNVIRSFYEEIFKMVPKGSALEMKQMFIRENIAYVAWSCESLFVTIPIGADSFIVENDKIKYQTLGAHIIPK
jgi:hypothetical protein